MVERFDVFLNFMPKKYGSFATPFFLQAEKYENIILTF